MEPHILSSESVLPPPKIKKRFPWLTILIAFLSFMMGMGQVNKNCASNYRYLDNQYQSLKRMFDMSQQQGADCQVKLIDQQYITPKPFGTPTPTPYDGHKTKDGKQYTEAYYSLTNKCTQDECILRNDYNDIIGYGTIKGYYETEEIPDSYNGSKTLCDGLTLTGGSEDIRNFLTSTDSAKVIINPGKISDAAWQRVKTSTSANTVTLHVMVRIPPEMDILGCYSPVDIVSVE